jgi:hypothetical protein
VKAIKSGGHDSSAPEDVRRAWQLFDIDEEGAALMAVPLTVVPYPDMSLTVVPNSDVPLTVVPNSDVSLTVVPYPDVSLTAVSFACYTPL